MSALAGLPVLTAAQVRAAEEAAIATGRTVADLMEAAGAGVARWTARLASGAPILIICGPGNNGGDGYVAARRLLTGGADVTVAALGEPRSDAARAAAAGWSGPTTTLADARTAPIVVDALFGTGTGRAYDDAVAFAGLMAGARFRIALDLPSGLDADLANAPRPVSPCDVTLAIGMLKPAHVLQPGATWCGTVRLVDLGLAGVSQPATGVLARPWIEAPGALTHKYTRGTVTVVAGSMPGASILCATAALRAGAGYVSLVGAEQPGGPAALVHRPFDPVALYGSSGGTIVIGPGLGRNQAAQRKLAAALDAPTWLVIDGDALRLIDPENIPWHCVLTPHAGEFEAVFGKGAGSKIDRTRMAARRAGCVVVYKGADTVIASPDGRVQIAPVGSHWLATAGSGDVLAGAIAARIARLAPPPAPGALRRPHDDAIAAPMHDLAEAAATGVWMHARAAQVAGGGFIADDLAAALGIVQARAA